MYSTANGTKTDSVMTSCKIFNCPRLSCGVADAVGGHLHQVLEQRDAPADQRRHIPGRRGEILQVPVPREGHEQVGHGEHQRRDQQRVGDQAHGNFPARRSISQVSSGTILIAPHGHSETQMPQPLQ